MTWTKITETNLPPVKSDLIMWFREDKRFIYGEDHKWANVLTGDEVDKLSKYFSHFCLNEKDCIITPPDQV